MRISKPDDLLILLYRGRLGGERVLVVTLGYAIGADGKRLPETEIWPWLKDRFGKQPFDVGMPKSRGTVAVHGAACAPGGTPVGEMAIRVRCAEVDKQLLAFGDRTWTRTLVGQWRATDPQPFTRMPVTLDRAYGGAGYADNPEGRGYLPDSSAAEGAALPNIEHPDRLCLAPKDRMPPATLVPLPQQAPARTRYLGRFDDTWRRRDFPFVPRDSDPRYFDAVPEDQCLPGFFNGDEIWSVEGMHPDRARVEGRLPGLRLRLLARFAGGETGDDDAGVVEAPVQLDTVWLFPADERAVALHRATIAVATDDASDVSELGVFVEALDQAPADRDALLAAWPRTPAPEYKPVEMAALQAAGEEKRAQLNAAAAAASEPDPRWTKFADEVWADISQSYEKAVADTQKQAERAGLPFERPPPLERPVFTATTPAPVDWRAFAAEIESDLEASLKEAESQTRKALADLGIDPDEAMAKAAAQSAQPPDPMASIDAAPLSAAEKADLKSRVAALQKEIADIEAQIEAMSKKFAERSGAGAAVPAAESASAAASAAGMPMDRDTLLARHKAGERVAGAQLTGQDLSGIDLSGADLSGTRFVDCQLRGARLQGATLTDALFQRCDLSQADCSKIVAGSVAAESCTAAAASFSGAALADSRWQDCDLTGADLSGVDAKSAMFSDCRFNGAKLGGFTGAQSRWARCNLGAASAAGADFSQAQWTEVVLDDTVLEDAVLEGTTLWTVRGSGTRLTKAKLRGLRTGGGSSLYRADFTDADLSDASLQDTALVAGQLQRAVCDRALFLRCDLTTVDGYRAVARRAAFNRSTLKDTRWVAANLMEASFCGATLDCVDLTGANLFATETFGARLDRLVLTRAYTARSGFAEAAA